MGEQHLHLLAIAPRLRVLRCLCDLERDIPRSLVHAARDLAVSHVGPAPLLHGASTAIVLVPPVDDRAILGDANKIGRLRAYVNVSYTARQRERQVPGKTIER